MNKRARISQRPGIGRVLSIALMCCCLTFLTSINYFLYPSEKQASANTAPGQDQGMNKTGFPPSGPTEEKSSSQSFSFVEEFLHDPHPVINFGIIAQMAMHSMAGPGRILVYHGELLSPPPEL